MMRRTLTIRILKILIFLLIGVTVLQLYIILFYTEFTKTVDDVIVVESQPSTYHPSRSKDCIKLTQVTEDKKPLLSKIPRDKHWGWIHDRIDNSWDVWIQALAGIRKTAELDGFPKKNVLVNPGVLMATTWSQNETVKYGGPQGDLVQWSDLILALYMLGHNVTFEKDFYQVARGLLYDKFTWPSENDECKDETVDILYADIISVKTYPQKAINKHKNLFRVIDAYGTEAMYNDPEFATEHNYKSYYGKLGLHLKQFYTFYPHTDDNTFLGFAVPTVPQSPHQIKQNIGILYGKDATYFKDHANYIKLLMQYFEVHSTLQNISSLPEGVVNHGILTARDYRTLLSKAKYFIGVGLPLESTGVMEALSHGCMFLNPIFKGNDTHILQKQDKPTSRIMTSQVPYLEEYIGPPHVYTIDISNDTSVRHIVSSISKLKVPNFIPEKFTIEAFIHRVSRLTQEQSFRQSPASSVCPDVKIVVSKNGESCSQACRKLNPTLACDPLCFANLNENRVFKRLGIKCQKVQTAVHVIYPGFYNDEETCILQENNNLFSCAGSITNFKRICPCR